MISDQQQAAKKVAARPQGVVLIGTTKQGIMPAPVQTQQIIPRAARTS